LFGLSLSLSLFLVWGGGEDIKGTYAFDFVDIHIKNEGLLGGNLNPGEKKRACAFRNPLLYTAFHF
jgi:hypothetical protein